MFYELKIELQNSFRAGQCNYEIGNYVEAYKFENRFTFKTIGDTERFHNSASHHDVFRSFRNRHFVNQKQGLTYSSLFGDDGNATVDGRMVGRTRFFLTDSDGNNLISLGDDYGSLTFDYEYNWGSGSSKSEI